MDPAYECMMKDRFAAHCGIELVSMGEGRAVTRMAVKPEHLNGLGVAHGGAIFTLADYAFAAACNSAALMSLAVNVSINFVKAGGLSGTLTAEARPVAGNPKLSTYQVEVKNEAGEIIAVFQGLAYQKVPNKAK